MADPSRAERLRAWHASLVDGGCPVCGTVPPPEHTGCRPCYARKERERAAAERAERYRVWTGESLRTLPKFPFASFDNSAWVEQLHPELLSLVSAWDGTSSLMLHGETGIGKTTTPAARIRAKIEAMRAAVAAGEPEDYSFTFVFTTEADVLDAHRMYKLGTEEPKLHRRMRECSLLMLDEMGFQHDAGIPIVAKFIDARYRAALPTVITTGLTHAQFTEKYSAAFVRRILQSGTGGEFLDIPPRKKKYVLPR